MVKLRETGDNYVICSFKICTAHHTRTSCPSNKGG